MDSLEFCTLCSQGWFSVQLYHDSEFSLCFCSLFEDLIFMRAGILSFHFMSQCRFNYWVCYVWKRFGLFLVLPVKICISVYPVLDFVVDSSHDLIKIIWLCVG